VRLPLRLNPALALMALGLVFTAILVNIAWNDALENEEREFAADADGVRDNLFQRVGAAEEVITSLVTLVNSTPRVDGDQFRLFSAVERERGDFERRAVPAQGDLDFSPHGGDGRPKVVGHVRDDPSLRLVGPVEPLQHGVQHRHQTAELGHVGVLRNPLPRHAGLDRLRLRGDLRDRRHGGARKPDGPEGRGHGAQEHGAEQQEQDFPVLLRQRM